MPEEKNKETKSRPVRSFFKTFVDVKKWSSYDEVSINTKTTFQMFRRFFSRRTGIPLKETYDQSIARLGLTEKQLADRKKAFLYSALIYAVIAAFLFAYFIFLLINTYFFSASLNFLLACSLSIIAYREHFWYMQMQKKKLGCSFSEWISFILGRNG